MSLSSDLSQPEEAPMAVDAPSAQSSRIRANFLNKLGIDLVDGHKEIPVARARSMLGKVQVHQEPLKFHDDAAIVSNSWIHFFGIPKSEDVSLASSPASISSDSLSNKSNDRPRITFNTEVKVLPIPMRDEYSKRVKDRLWTNAEEISFNAQRNAMEFAAEGWDWRSALEDENMYRDSVSGELIHPIHCMQHE